MIFIKVVIRTNRKELIRLYNFAQLHQKRLCVYLEIQLPNIDNFAKQYVDEFKYLSAVSVISICSGLVRALFFNMKFRKLIIFVKVFD